jgi:putative tryptophan/tyrosine transport system substrate-binding protein
LKLSCSREASLAADCDAYPVARAEPRDLGYVEQKNLVIEFPNAQQQFDRYIEAKTELVLRNVDIIIAADAEIALKSAVAATNALPIVMFAIDYDPLALGYVTSLARPTGNVTGLFFQQIALSEKRLQRMKDAFSPMRSATVLWDAVSTDQWRATQGAATKLGLQAVGIEFRGPPDQREFIDVRNGSRAAFATALASRPMYLR